MASGLKEKGNFSFNKDTEPIGYNFALIELDFCGVPFLKGDFFKMAFEVTVDKEKCKGCEECLEACTVEVFEMQESKSVPVNVRECLGCQSCVEVCKEKAITVKELETEMSEIARMLLKDIL